MGFLKKLRIEWKSWCKLWKWELDLQVKLNAAIELNDWERRRN